MGIQMLLYAVFGATERISGLKVLDKGVLMGFIYVFWAIGQFFDGRKKVNYLKGLFSYILGMITFMLLAVVLGALIDLIAK